MVVFLKKANPEINKKRERMIVIKLKKYLEQLNTLNAKKKLGDRMNEIQENDTKVQDINEMEDLSKEELPGLDISEGLREIEKNKNAINEGISFLTKQVGTMMEQANLMKDEMEKQSELLEKIGTDLNKHTQKLGSLNKTMDKALAAAGGPTKMVLVIIIFAVILGLLAVLYGLLEYFVFSKI